MEQSRKTSALEGASTKSRREAQRAASDLDADRGCSRKRLGSLFDEAGDPLSRKSIRCGQEAD
ncbi:MAG: hypothetical protein PHW10_04290 [Candidatus Peribacteraceae bacterium]|nr:hypothetical protein [Candidatus Peribacteraceae bacterium]